jgi:tRNA uridine 5-carbamoylmethylation protein Kti12
MYFYWNSVKDAPLPIKRSKIKNAFWEDVITNYVKKNVITNGLTIPYLVGVLKVKYSMKPTKETLSELISNLISSTSENKPVLQFCPEVNEYVVSLRSEVFCETNFKTEIFFRNVSNAKTLYITQNASQFGKTKEELVNSLWDRYGEQMEHNLFSWKPIKQQWFPFDENEIQRILWVEEM